MQGDTADGPLVGASGGQISDCNQFGPPSPALEDERTVKE